jgi:putative endonuclease
MRSESQAKGRRWELEAASFLTDAGLEIVDSGYRCRLGELDLVCRDGASLVIVEVRARRNGRHGCAAETVDGIKQRKILRATRHFLMRHPECAERPLRFDVVAVDDIDSMQPKLHWIKDAFQCS